MKKATEAMKASEIESLIAGASDWNQVLERFADRVSPTQTTPTTSSALPEEKLIVVDLVKELYWNIEEKVIEQVRVFQFFSFILFFLASTDCGQGVESPKLGHKECGSRVARNEYQ